jgi:cell division septum initiation protein DivIVA
MAAMGVQDQIKSAFQDIIAPELHAFRGDIQRLDQKIDNLDTRVTVRLDSLRTETVSMRASSSPRSGGSTRASTASIANCRQPSTSANVSPPSKPGAAPDVALSAGRLISAR